MPSWRSRLVPSPRPTIALVCVAAALLPLHHGRTKTSRAVGTTRALLLPNKGRCFSSCIEIRLLCIAALPKLPEQLVIA